MSQWHNNIVTKCVITMLFRHTLSNKSTTLLVTKNYSTHNSILACNAWQWPQTSLVLIYVNTVLFLLPLLGYALLHTEVYWKAIRHAVSVAPLYISPGPQLLIAPEGHRVTDLPFYIFACVLCMFIRCRWSHLIPQDESPSLRDTWPTTLILAKLPCLKISLLLNSWDKF